MYSCILLVRLFLLIAAVKSSDMVVLILSFKLFNGKSRVIYLEQIEHLPRFEHYLKFPLWECSVEHSACSE